ncbi:MAG: DUF2461 domain-containing protein [Chloroflexota bacterium]|nr:DUF2461 domain-containing protein [Chloroflexota bacterium]
MADTPAEPTQFRGFEPDALQFLADLAANNDRSWFKPRKTEYERLVKEPLEALCVALADRFEKLRLPLEADPVRSPFRIYRDVRFSKDKSPYKTAQGADFPWQDSRGDELRPRGAVGGYFHLEPGNIFVGGGMWHPERARLAAFREKLDRDPSAVFRAIEDERFRSVFGSVTGESLTRNPKGFPSDHPYGNLLRLKDVVFSRPLSDRDVFSPELPDVIAHDLDAARPVLLFLDKLAGTPEHIN